ncbi:MAG: type II secretion system protein [Pseudomonadota bacterium]
MSMLSLRRSQKQSGFTLMELLIVIAVLGLLLGMLIPRLAGITDDTVDTVCDTNNKGIRYYTQSYYNKYNSLPNGLTNLVDYSNDSEGTHTYNDGESNVPLYLPSYQDDVANDTAEALAEEFYTRNFPGGWELDAAEVAELKALGITYVYNYVGDKTDSNTTRSMMRETLSEECYVMMAGASYDGTDVAIIDTDGTNMGNPFWVGRMMMAVNDQCDLVTKGFIQASALCPGAVLAEENFSIKEYILVLPRLEATVAKFQTGGILSDGDVLEFIDNGRADDDSGRVIEMTFAAQSGWEFDMSCPEGHKWPDNDEDSWDFYSYTAGGETGAANGTGWTFTATGTGE